MTILPAILIILLCNFKILVAATAHDADFANTMAVIRTLRPIFEKGQFPLQFSPQDSLGPTDQIMLHHLTTVIHEPENNQAISALSESIYSRYIMSFHTVWLNLRWYLRGRVTRGLMGTPLLVPQQTQVTLLEFLRRETLHKGHPCLLPLLLAPRNNQEISNDGLPNRFVVPLSARITLQYFKVPVEGLSAAHLETIDCLGAIYARVDFFCWWNVAYHSRKFDNFVLPGSFELKWNPEKTIALAQAENAWDMAVTFFHPKVKPLITPNVLIEGAESFFAAVSESNRTILQTIFADQESKNPAINQLLGKIYPTNTSTFSNEDNQGASFKEGWQRLSSFLFDSSIKSDLRFLTIYTTSSAENYIQKKFTDMFSMSRVHNPHFKPSIVIILADAAVEVPNTLHTPVHNRLGFEIENPLVYDLVDVSDVAGDTMHLTVYGERDYLGPGFDRKVGWAPGTKPTMPELPPPDYSGLDENLREETVGDITEVKQIRSYPSYNQSSKSDIPDPSNQDESFTNDQKDIADDSNSQSTFSTTTNSSNQDKQQRHIAGFSFNNWKSCIAIVFFICGCIIVLALFVLYLRWKVAMSKVKTVKMVAREGFHASIALYDHNKR